MEYRASIEDRRFREEVREWLRANKPEERRPDTFAEQIGYQSECDAHWFMKRAHLYDQAGGGMQAQARRVVDEPSPLW